MKIFKDALKLIEDQKVKRITIGKIGPMGILYEVDGNNVRIFRKPGRTLMSCDCSNGTKFCNDYPLCQHKIAAVIFEAAWKD